jgi:glycosyltransferase involved in cell wall biosynthesis
MNLLFVNTYESTGGAAIAARRLMYALIDANEDDATAIESFELLTRGDGWRARLCFLWERFVIWLRNGHKRDTLFMVDIANAGIDITRSRVFREADVVHLHWVNQGMLSCRTIEKILASGKKIIWTMHDMWCCTAICHHARDCTRYRTACGRCPYLNSARDNDLAAAVFRRKQRMYAAATDLTFVAPSQWLAEQAAQSALIGRFPIHVIPNPIDVRMFDPTLSKDSDRAALDLPCDKRLLLFSAAKATDKRKGIDYFIEACRIVCDIYPAAVEHYGIVLVGKHGEDVASRLPLPTFVQGYVDDDEVTLSTLYALADLYVTPSLEENLPNTIIEAMACGTPCVGFATGGIPELIDHGVNGYVARYADAADMARGILQLLNADDYDLLCRRAARKVRERYREGIVAAQYKQLYRHDV